MKLPVAVPITLDMGLPAHPSASPPRGGSTLGAPAVSLDGACAPEAPDFARWTELLRSTLRAPTAFVLLAGRRGGSFAGAPGTRMPATEPGDELSHWAATTVATQGRPIVCASIAEDSRLASLLRGARRDVTACVAIPLRSRQGHVLGALCAFDARVRAWTGPELTAAREIARGVERDVHAWASGRDLERLEHLLAAHHEVHALIGGGAELEPVLEALARGVQSQAGGLSAAVLLLDESGRSVRRAVAPALSEGYRRAAEGLDRSAVAALLESVPAGTPLIVDDVYARAAAPVLAGVGAAHGQRSCWARRLSGGDGRPAGVLVLHGTRPREPFTGERALLEHAGRLAEVALERHRAEQHLISLADRDPLTGLSNRAVLLRRLRAMREAGSPVALLFLDLNRFKLINDSLGHAAGDLVLTTVARRLSAFAAPGDVVARMGGDEFVIAAPGLDVAGARRTADYIRLLLSEPIPDADAGCLHSVSASIGIAFSQDAADPEDLLQQADTAMYEAKHGQGGVMVYASSLRDEAVRELRLHSALVGAIGRGELHVAFQPLLGLRDGRVAGAEALVRWTHPELGAVSPGEFIPLAEDRGLIGPIGDWVLEQAVAAAVRWRDQTGRLVPVGVNVSARQLADPGLADRVEGILEAAGLPPEGLEIEVTETALVSDGAVSEMNLRALDEVGVSIALDDFGTGFSSLSHLRRLPIDRVKIDRSFVDGMGADSDDEAIVAGVIGLARGLGLGTTAEGVETERQERALRKLGCELVQGWRYGRPEAEGVIVERLHAEAQAPGGFVAALDDRRTAAVLPAP